jgi:hypothetical protein
VFNSVKNPSLCSSNSKVETKSVLLGKDPPYFYSNWSLSKNFSSSFLASLAGRVFIFSFVNSGIKM